MRLRPDGSPRSAGAALVLRSRTMLVSATARSLHTANNPYPEVPVFHTPHPSLVPRVTLITAAVLVGTLSGCSSAESAPALPTSTSSATSSAAAELAPQQVPVPGSTVAASAIAVPDDIPADLSVTVVAPEVTGVAAADTAATIAELRSLTDVHGASSISFLPAESEPDVPAVHVDGDALLLSALAERPDVIVVLGESILTELDGVSASNLDQQFVLLGAQLPEPTANVTAVVWPGADVRLADGISPEIAPRALQALQAGLSAVASDSTGIVLDLG